VIIGVFDGVHRGHQQIIAAARAGGPPLVAVTFDPHPAEVVRPGSHPPLLCTLDRRVRLLGEQGAAAVCVLAFTPGFSQMPPEEFVRTVLTGRLHARRVVVGQNFRFGHRAAGDAHLLAELGRAHGFRTEAVPLLGGAAGTVSSSAIRSQIAAGDVIAAARGLGRPHRVEGVVVRGQRRGRQLGFPTANLETPPHTAIPADGVYAGWLLAPGPARAPATAGAPASGSASPAPARAPAIPEPPDYPGARCWPAALSVGTNPTFSGRDRVVEAYALDRDDLELYGLHVAVDFSARLRGMVTFSSAGELVEQMRKDVDQARSLVAAGS
jgi:riboflavin kinase/FMN adenylyltransferase